MSMNRERLGKLADFLDTLPDESWRYHDFVSRTDRSRTCGTVCCALGWMPKVDPDRWSWDKTLLGLRLLPSLRSGWCLDPVNSAASYFRIGVNTADKIFVGANVYFRGLTLHMVKPRHVATLIRHLMKHSRLPKRGELPA